MTSNEAFRSAFQESASGGDSRRQYTPEGVVGSWSFVVGECENGYDDNIYEYVEDLWVRRIIETVLLDDSLQKFPQMKNFRERVEVVDERFRRLLGGGTIPVMRGRPWWSAGVPRYAGQELADDLKKDYGIIVDVWSRDE